MKAVPWIQSLEDFASFFGSTSPWVLWFGSAVSVEKPSAVPMGPAIIGALIKELASGTEPCRPAVERMLRQGRRDLDRNGRRDLSARHVPFEVILGEVANHTEMFVPRLLEELMPSSTTAPNRNHEAIAELFRHGLVDLLVTTNFDECQEAALGTIAPPPMVPVSGPFTVSGPGLLKLHGTISDPPTLAATPEGLGSRSTDEWRGSLAAALAGRNILFVGYGFNDPFDIQPALRRAVQQGAHVYWACRGADADIGRLEFEVTSLIPHDLGDPRRNLLRMLADTKPLDRAAPHGMSSIEQRASAEAAVDRTRDACPLPVDRKLAAFAALFYWIEEGDLALRYFEAAAACPGATSVDRHTLARASLRARRGRRAVRLFDAMLREELPEADPERAAKEIDWCIGAGHVARTGGRPRLARTYFARARRALNRSGLRLEEDPYLADQVMRSQAGEEVEAARMSATPARRARHLVLADDWLDRLQRVPGLSLSTRPLLDLERARIALLRGDRRAALARLEDARRTIDPLRDLHVVTMCDRLTAVAHRDDASLVALAEAAKARGQWIEWAKIRAEALGFTGYGRRLRLQRALHNLLLASWDLAKDVLLPI